MTIVADPRREPRYQLRAKPGNHWSDARIAAGLSLRQLATASGVSPTFLSLLEQGRYTPTPDEAEAIVAALRGATRQAPA